MTCPKCQKDIAASSKFCHHCGAKQPEAAPTPSGWDVLRLIATIAFVNLARYYGWESVVGLLLLLVAFLLIVWLLARLLQFLWRRFLHQRWKGFSAWWVCKRNRCDYYQIYQAYGPAHLTHVGYHAAEQLAWEHLLSHSGDSSSGCKVCKDWAERLRGELWGKLMSGDSNPDPPCAPETILEAKKRQFGFVSGPNKKRRKN